MKNLLLILAILLSNFHLFAQEPLVKFYLKDGSSKQYLIDNIESIELPKNIQSHYIMKIYYQDSLTMYYPAISIDSLKFIIDSNNIRNLNVYNYGFQRNFSLSEIDSIIFYQLITKISDNVLIIDSTQSNEILSVDSSRIEIFIGSQIGQNLKVGDIIVSDTNKLSPNGFLRKVKSFYSDNEKIFVETEDANITDIIESGIISFFWELSPDDTICSSVKKNNDVILGNKNGFTFGLKDVELVPSVKIDGSITLNPGLGFNMVIENRELKQILFQLTTECNTKIEVHADVKTEIKLFKVSLNELLKIPPFRLKPIVTKVGPVPIVFCSNIDFWTGCTLTIGGEVRTGIYQDGTITGGFEYHSGQWRNISEHKTTFIFKPPTLSVGGGIKATFGPQLNIFPYGNKDVFNGYSYFNLFDELKVDFLKTPLWQDWVGIETNAGLKSKWFDFDKKLPIVAEYRMLLKQATDQIKSVEPLEGEWGDTITVKGKGFGNIRGLNYISIIASESFLDSYQAIDYPAWSDKEVKFILPNNLPFKPVKIVMNIDGIWTELKDFTVNQPKIPVITEITPDSGEAGFDIYIKGKYFRAFQDSSFVSFNGLRSWVYNLWSDSLISCVVPYDTKTGKLWIDKKGLKSNQVDFTFIPNLSGKIKIGEQIWMDKNLNTDHYRNGDLIPQVQNEVQWKNLTTGAWCYYNNDSANGAIYGKLYNWYAVNDPRGLAPDGWHVPSDSEWVDLYNYIRIIFPRCFPGQKMKETGTEHWKYTSLSVTNETGFTALPGGLRTNWFDSYIFKWINENSFFWTSTPRSDMPNKEAMSRYIYTIMDDLSIDSNTLNTGLSVRCLKDK